MHRLCIVTLIIFTLAPVICGRLTAQTLVDLRTQSKSVDFSAANTTKPVKSGTVLPATCSVGEMFYNTAAAPGQNLFGCTALNSWTLQGSGLPNMLGTAGKLLSSDGSNATWTAIGGDITGLPSAVVVNQILGRPLSATLPLAGQALVWTGSSWTPQTIQAGSGGSALPSMTNQAGKVLSTDGTNAIWSALAGDVSGAPGASIVTRIQSQPVSSATPQSGQVLVWNSGTGRWEPQSIQVSGGGGSGGATMSNQLGDLAVVRNTANSLNIGAACNAVTPCNVRFGSVVYTYTTPATVTVNSGTGLAFIYISGAGLITVGQNMNVTCSGPCTAQSGITGFPADSIPLASWNATNGSWDPLGGIDQRAFLSTKTIVAGTGLIASDSTGQAMLSVDSSTVGLRVAVPATATSNCISGSWAADASFFYICASANTWRRVATAAW